MGSASSRAAWGLIAALAMACEIAPVSTTDDPSAQPSTRLRAQVAIERGLDYLTTQPLQTDEAWLLHQAAAYLGPRHAERIASLPPPVDLARSSATSDDVSALPALLWRTRALSPPSWPSTPPRPSALPPGPDAPGPAAPGPNHVDRTVAVVEAALRCRPGSPHASRLLHEVQQPGSGYLLTHQLWAIVLATARRCIPVDEAEPHRLALAQHVLRELQAEPRISDLEVERAAMLCFAGLQGWVPPTMIEELTNAQAKDGSWRRPHQTALTILLLACDSSPSPSQHR